MVSLSHMPPKKGKTKFDYVHSSLVSSHLLVTLKFFFYCLSKNDGECLYIYIDAYIYILYFFFCCKDTTFLSKNENTFSFIKEKREIIWRNFYHRLLYV